MPGDAATTAAQSTRQLPMRQVLPTNNKTKLYDKHTFLQTLFRVHAPQRSPQRAKPPDRYIKRRDFSSN